MYYTFKGNLNQTESKRNFAGFIWHGLFLALASNFMDVNTVIPSMLLKLGADSVHLGILTAIMIGGASFMQLVFSLMLQPAIFKKKWLITGIYIRVMMLIALAMLFLISSKMSFFWLLVLVYLFISIFSFSGSFASVSYMDIIGKTINKEIRKKFFSLKQVINGVGVLISAFAAGWVLKNIDYPDNFFRLFLIAAALLFLASFGFWYLSEKTPSGVNIRGIKSFNDNMLREIKSNLNLRYYLLIINTLGVGLSIVPFLIMLAKSQQGLSFDKIGSFLIYQTIGMISGSLILYFGADKFKYQKVLFFDVFLSVAILILALILKNNPNYFSYIFILTGLFASTYKVVNQGILVEISSNTNRTLYTGIAGAGNLFPMLVPVLMGVLWKLFNIETIFISVIIIVLLGLIPVFKLKCKS